MSILPLAAWPAATKVAQAAVAGTAQVGESFLKLVGDWTDANPDASPPALNLGDTNIQSPNAKPKVSDALGQRTESFSQRFAGWLRQQPWYPSIRDGGAQLDVELSLDRLDRPQATLAGRSSPEMDQALLDDPSWLQEFRDLALDRIEQSGSFDTNSAPPSLTIQPLSDTIDAEDAVDYRWR